MSSLKKLASQTAYYGLSSILGRMLNYALVPLHTRVLTNQQDYGVIGELYAYVTFLNIIFLFGMETAFFRFATKSDDRQGVYSNSFSLVLVTSVFLTACIFFFAGPILSWLSMNGSGSALYRREYVQIFALILGLDAISAIPFSKLRLDNRPLKFASIRVANILINVFFNCYFLLLCPLLKQSYPDSIFVSFYNVNDSVLYVFIANLIASACTLILLYQEIIAAKFRLMLPVLKPMLIYTLPLLFAGLAGMTNETLDRILLKYYLPGTIEERLAQIGIYNAAYKLSIFMTLAIQAFRMAAEPFFFSLSKDLNARDVYARVMNYFVIACCIIFLGVMTHIHIIELILGEGYREGLFVVPILLLANLFLGIYLNLSIWYKLTDQTSYGALFTLVGSVITVVLNILWIPVFGFEGSAYATLICYLTMAVLSYLFGQKYYPVAYNIRKIGSYLLLMMAFYFLTELMNKYLFSSYTMLTQLSNTAVLLAFILIVYYRDVRSLIPQKNNYGN